MSFDIIYNVQLQMFARQKGQNHLEADRVPLNAWVLISTS
jgi:hypothetical protein